MLFVNLLIFETRCNLGLNSEWSALNISTFQLNAICLSPICAIEHLALLLCKSCYFSGSLYANFIENYGVKIRSNLCLAGCLHTIRQYVKKLFGNLSIINQSKSELFFLIPKGKHLQCSFYDTMLHRFLLIF